MNTKTILLLVGLVIGGILGWVTAPKTVDVQVGPLSLEVSGDNGGGTMTATEQNGQIKIQVGNSSPLDDRNTRTLIFAIVGAAAGFGAGFLMDRRKA